MQAFPMKNLVSNKSNLRRFWFGLCILFLGFSLNSCSTYTRNFQVQENSISTYTPAYLEDFQEASFKVSIEAFGNQFGGIMVAKRLGFNHFRFAMINEFGGKLLDFELINQKLELNYAIEQLNRKMLLNLLEKDFSMIFSENNPILKTFVSNGNTILAGQNSIYYQLKEDTLNEIHFAKNKLKTRIEIISSEEILPNFDIQHENMPIKIFLHLLPNQ